MSYDLYFKVKDDTFSFQSFCNHFSRRKNYFLNLDKKEAIYENDITGVYFYFDYCIKEKNHDLEENYDITFSINYLRPFPFLLEASIEIKALLADFHCEIEDPQQEEKNVFAEKFFFEEWLKQNQIILKSNPELVSNLYEMPLTLLTFTWRWNYLLSILNEYDNLNKVYFKPNKTNDALINVEFLQLLLNKPYIFLPKIYFALIENHVKTLIIWSNAIPIAIPKNIDLVILNTEEGASSSIIQKEYLSIVDFQIILPILNDYETREDYYLLDYSSAEIPQKISHLFNIRNPFTNAIEFLAYDRLISTE